VLPTSRRVRPGALLILLVLLAPGALAHSVGARLPGDTLERATQMGPPPGRLFGSIDAGEGHYHRFSTGGAPEVRLRVFAPHGAPPVGLVLVILFGPGLPEDTPVPPDIERPPGMGALAFPASGREEMLDARVPARRIVLLDRALALADAEHVLVVRAEADARIAVFVEAPGMSLVDLAIVPSQRSEERAWAGAPAWATYAAGIAGAALVAPFAWRWRARHWPLLAILGVTAAGFFAASTGVLLLDASRARGVPWLLLAANALVTIAALAAAGMRGRPALRRLLLGLAGIAGVLAWAGFLWGPLVAVAGALLPEPAKQD